MLNHSQENQKSRKTPRYAQRKSQEMNGNGVTQHVLPGMFPTVVNRTEFSFFWGVPAFSTYLYSYAFLPALLHYSSVWLDLIVSLTSSSFFVLYGLSSVFQYLLPAIHLVSNDSWASPSNWEIVSEFDTQCSLCVCCFLTMCCLCSFCLALCSILLASERDAEGWKWRGMSW